MNVLLKFPLRVLCAVIGFAFVPLAGLSAQGLFAGGLFADKPLPTEVRSNFPVAVQDGCFSSERPAISNDGKELYYSELEGWADPGQYRIKWYHFDKTSLVGPDVLFEGFIAPFLAPDGKTLYFQRIESGKVSTWFSNRMASGWSEPQAAKNPQTGMSGYTVTDSGRIYALTSGTSSVGGTDICVMDPAKGDGFVSIGKPVNTRGNDKDFYMAPDESFVVFTSPDASRRGTRQGELCMSFHKPDGTWTDPLGLGHEANQGGDGGHWGPWVSRGGSVLFFTSGNSPATVGIRWIAFGKILDALKKKALD